MSLVRGRHEIRTILDFSKGKISKNSVKQALRKVEVLEIYQKEENINTFVDNYIQVGMYEIYLGLKGAPSRDRTRLKNYGCFHVAVYEKKDKKSPSSLKNINLNNDGRFKNQYWVGLNSNSKLRTKNLVDVIMHARRLNDLRLFL